jgi:hypothetical protein
MGKHCHRIAPGSLKTQHTLLMQRNALFPADMHALRTQTPPFHLPAATLKAQRLAPVL